MLAAKILHDGFIQGFKINYSDQKQLLETYNLKLAAMNPIHQL